MTPLPALIIFIVFFIVFLIYAGFIIHHLITYRYPGDALFSMLVLFIAGGGGIVLLALLFLFTDFGITMFA